MSRADELVRYRELMVGIDRSDEGELTSYHQAEKTIKDLEAQLAAEKQAHEDTRRRYEGVAG